MKRLTEYLDDFLCATFRLIGYAVADCPIPVIVVMLILTVIASVKLPFVVIEDDYKVGFTPTDARAMREIEIHREFSKGEMMTTILMLTASDGGSMARMQHLNDTVNILHKVNTGFKVNNISFNDFCGNLCLVNEPIVLFRNGLLMSEGRRNESSNVTEGIFDDNFNMSFPIMSIFGQNLDLSRSFFGVETYTQDRMPVDAASNIASVKVIALVFHAVRPRTWTVNDANLWDESVRSHYLQYTNSSSNVRTHPYSIPYLQSEISRTSQSILPYIVPGFVLMCIFSILSIYLQARALGQWHVDKLVCGVVVCITPLLASASALGLIVWCGFRFASILLLTPFLVLAIGVDDAYIVINSWERLCIDMMKRKPANDSLRQRISQVLVDVGPSITITSLTNLLAFGVGALSAPPDIQLFCIANALAMALDLVYTCTLLLAVVTLCGRFELRAEKVNVKVTPVNTAHKHTASPISRAFAGNVNNVWLSYCEWLSKPTVSLMVFIMLLVYWTCGIYGISQVKPGLTPTKLFIEDSPLIEVMHIRDEYIRNERTFVTVIVGDAGDLLNNTRRERIHTMVQQLEGIPESRGSLFSMFWMRDYETFLQNERDLEEFDEDSSQQQYNYQSIDDFLAWPEYRHWAAFMNIDHAHQRIDNFSLVVTYHGQNLSYYEQKLVLLTKWRQIVDNYTELSASVYDDFAQFTDQIKTLVPRTVMSSLYTLTSMVIVCCFFMPSAKVVMAASLSVFSIFIGVSGFLTLWGVDLDPISTTTLILSIGMSVDYPAHVTFHYYRKATDDNAKWTNRRMADALSVISYPLLQCCLSNLILLCCLLFVTAYTSQVIVKTVALVVTFGSIHSLVVIPAFICASCPKFICCSHQQQ